MTWFSLVVYFLSPNLLVHGFCSWEPAGHSKWWDFDTDWSDDVCTTVVCFRGLTATSFSVSPWSSFPCCARSSEICHGVVTLAFATVDSLTLTWGPLFDSLLCSLCNMMWLHRHSVVQSFHIIPCRRGWCIWSPVYLYNTRKTVVIWPNYN